MTCHSEKQDTAPTYKGGFGYHPLLCFPANTGGALAGRLRPGNAGANSASDHMTVLDDALAQIPDARRYGTDILISTDSAGCSKLFLSHIRDLCERGIRTSFSAGHAVTEPIRRAIRMVPDRLWHPPLDQDGSLRDGAEASTPHRVTRPAPTSGKAPTHRTHALAYVNQGAGTPGGWSDSARGVSDEGGVHRGGFGQGARFWSAAFVSGPDGLHTADAFGGPQRFGCRQ